MLKPLRLRQVVPEAAKEGIERVEQMQTGIGDRLGSLRENRVALSEAAAQPALRDISEQEAYAKRHIELEGSLGDRRRSDISGQADLARQDIKSRAFSQQIQSEQGLQQLKNEFSAMFSDMANTQFTQALSGLGEEIDQYMAEKGRALKYSDLATKAQAASDRMLGRLASGMGSAFSDEGKAQRGSEGYQATNVDYSDTGYYDDEV